MRRSNSTWNTGLMWLLSILVLSGCVSPTVRPELPRPAVPTNLQRACPKPPVPRDSSAPATLQAYLQALRLYRICADRHAKHVQATTPPSK